MRAPILNYEQLLKAKETVVEISMQGFLMNVANYYREGLITTKEKEEILSDFSSQNEI